MCAEDERWAGLDFHSYFLGGSSWRGDNTTQKHTLSRRTAHTVDAGDEFRKRNLFSYTRAQTTKDRIWFPTFDESSGDQFVQGQGKLNEPLFAALGTSRHPGCDPGHSRLSGTTSSTKLRASVSSTSSSFFLLIEWKCPPEESVRSSLCRLSPCSAGGREKEKKKQKR